MFAGTEFVRTIQSGLKAKGKALLETWQRNLCGTRGGTGRLVVAATTSHQGHAKPVWLLPTFAWRLLVVAFSAARVSLSLCLFNGS